MSLNVLGSTSGLVQDDGNKGGSDAQVTDMAFETPIALVLLGLALQNPDPLLRKSSGSRDILRLD